MIALLSYIVSHSTLTIKLFSLLGIALHIMVAMASLNHKVFKIKKIESLIISRIFTDGLFFLVVAIAMSTFNPGLMTGLMLIVMLSSVVNCVFLGGNSLVEKFIIYELLAAPLFYSAFCVNDFLSTSFAINIMSAVIVGFIHIMMTKTFRSKIEAENNERKVKKKIAELEDSIKGERERFIRHQLNNQVMMLSWKLSMAEGEDDKFNIMKNWAASAWQVLCPNQRRAHLKSIISEIKRDSSKDRAIEFVDQTGDNTVEVDTDIFLLKQFFMLAVENSIEAYEEIGSRAIIFFFFNHSTKTLCISDKAGGFDISKISLGFSTKNKKMTGTGGVGLATLLKLGELCNIQVIPRSVIGDGTTIEYHLENIIVGEEDGHGTENECQQAGVG